MRTTTYRFEVPTTTEEAFEGTLDILASLLSHPLFTESATERELSAVDSENSKNLVLDNRRQLQLLKACGKDHEYLKFSTGNMKTLRDVPVEKGIDVRKVICSGTAHVCTCMGVGVRVGVRGYADVHAVSRQLSEIIDPHPLLMSSSRCRATKGA